MSLSGSVVGQGRGATPAGQQPAGLLEGEGRFVLRTILLVMLIWTVLPALMFKALPLDVVESGMWGREWLIGSHKHPALPSWFLEVARLLSGGTLGWMAYLVSALFTGASLWLTYILVRTLVGAETAVLGMLTLATVEHFSWRSPEFNHDIAQIPFWVAVPLLAWLAVERGKLMWWALLGLVGALGLYAKLSHAVILLVVAGWLLYDTKARARLMTPGPWIALAIFVVVALPAVHWLLKTNFSPIEFAQERGRSARSLPEVLLNLVLVVSPAVILVLAARYWPAKTETQEAAPADARARLTLAIMTVAPILLGIVLSRLFGSSIRQDWMSPMLCLVPAFIIDRVVPRQILVGALERGKMVGLGLLIAIPVIYAGAVVVDRNLATSRLLRVNWPQLEIAAKLSDVWRQETGKPLKVVAGHPWIMGLVGINHPDLPSIMLSGDPKRSPWVSLERVKRQGALIAWEDRYPPEPSLKALIGNRQAKTLQFSLGVRRELLTVYYVVIPPAP